MAPLSNIRPWAMVAGLWTAWGLLWSAQAYAQSRYGANPYSVSAALAAQMPLAALWALFTPGIIWLSRRYPLEGRGWPAHAVIHLAVGLAVVFATGAFYVVNLQWVRGVPPEAPPVLVRAVRNFVYWALPDGLLYWIVVAVDHGARYHRRSRERELRAAQLEAQLADARLQALKTQLHPHFLFNALHTIGALVRTGQDALAVKVVAGLGDLLRRVLDTAATQEVPLKQELDFLRSYLDIEQVRFRDRLKVAIDAEPETLDARVPHLILQPLVENAIRHGLTPRTGVGHLLIVARRLDGMLHLTVRDDGLGIPDTGAGRLAPGVGIVNTRDRLAQLYGGDFTFEVVNAPDGGVMSHIAIPFRLHAAEWRGEEGIA